MSDIDIVPANTPLGAVLSRDTVTDEEIAAAKGVKITTVRRWAQQGLLPPKVGVGRRRGRDRKAVEKALAGL